MEIQNLIYLHDTVEIAIIWLYAIGENIYSLSFRLTSDSYNSWLINKPWHVVYFS